MRGMTLIDPDCRDGKHRSCVGGPCECACHERPTSLVSPETVAQMASALAFIVERHRPDTFTNGTMQSLTCQACSLLAGIPQAWPCDERSAVGHLIPDASNRLLEPPAVSLQPGGVPSSWPDG